jgi:hypothetical protein
LAHRSNIQATFAQWVEHQGNYLLRQLMFDVSMALSIEEQYELYVKYVAHQQKIATLGENGAWLSGEHNTNPAAAAPHTAAAGAAGAAVGARGRPGASTAAVVEKVLSFKPNMLWLLEQQRGRHAIADDDATYVINNLEFLFAAIGIVEKFDESLKMFETVFRLPFVKASKHRTKAQSRQQLHVHEGEDIKSRKRLQEEFVRQFAENPKLDAFIGWDLKLYERAREIFAGQQAWMARNTAAVNAAASAAEKATAWGGGAGGDEHGAGGMEPISPSFASAPSVAAALVKESAPAVWLKSLEAGAAPPPQVEEVAGVGNTLSGQHHPSLEHQFRSSNGEAETGLVSADSAAAEDNVAAAVGKHAVGVVVPAAAASIGASVATDPAAVDPYDDETKLGASLEADALVQHAKGTGLGAVLQQSSAEHDPKTKGFVEPEAETETETETEPEKVDIADEMDDEMRLAIGLEEEAMVRYTAKNGGRT